MSRYESLVFHSKYKITIRSINLFNAPSDKSFIHNLMFPSVITIHAGFGRRLKQLEMDGRMDLVNRVDTLVITLYLVAYIMAIISVTLLMW